MKLVKGDEYYGFQYVGETIDSLYLHKRPFKCKCGNIRLLSVYNIKTKKSKNCDQCNYVQLNTGDPYGKLVYTGKPVIIAPRSDKRLEFKCECGIQTIKQFKLIYSGNTKSCGKCSLITLNHNSRFGHLTYTGLSIKIKPHSSQKLPFLCDCGHIKSLIFKLVNSGQTLSCGQCNYIQLNTGEKFGCLTYTGESVKIGKHSSKKLLFSCNCGREKSIKLNVITNGRATRCGKCNEVILTPGNDYGNFTYAGEEIITTTKSAHQKFLFKCKCGQDKILPIYHVMSGHTKTCKNCRAIVYNWYCDNKSLLQEKLNELPPGGIISLEIIKNTATPFKAACLACGSTYYPRLSDIKRGRSLTCGCISDRVSSMNKEAQSFIASYGLEAIMEFKLDGKSYDICVPSCRLLIELNGLRWHSSSISKKNDFEKYEIARHNNYKLLSIYEDEWKHKNEIMKNIICNIIGTGVSIALRKNKCMINLIETKQANTFYDKHHYIGGVGHAAKYNYGVFSNDNLIGCMSFRKPTRQNCKYEWEISRMVMNPQYAVYAVWSNILKNFIKQVQPKSIVSYSDNRLFTGKVYRNMGMELDAELSPDYYWTNGDKRRHKSQCRKPKGCVVTEKVLRTAEGGKQIWDLGKKRWVLVC